MKQEEKNFEMVAIPYVSISLNAHKWKSEVAPFVSFTNNFSFFFIIILFHLHIFPILLCSLKGNYF